MKPVACISEHLEYFKNNEFSALEANPAMDDVATPQPHGDVEVKAAEKDPVSQEREQQLEAWMSDIKTFIRNIDTSKL
jgi:hypothetical protein